MLVARQAPVAADLREVFAVIRSINELEELDDEVDRLQERLLVPTADGGA